MPVKIGQPLESDYRNPLGLLSDCHRRIERFLNVLLTISRNVNGGELTAEQHRSLDIALKYFHNTAPLHTRDEEDSLFPRMREKSNAQNAARLAILDKLHTDHTSAVLRHELIYDLGSRWLNTGKLSPDDALLLNELLEGLSRKYANHIRIEEREVFPLAATLLGESELKAIAHEMASRRGLALDSGSR